MIQRRTFITGIAGLLAAAKAPAIILPHGSTGRVLMPVRPLLAGIEFCLSRPIYVVANDTLRVTQTLEYLDYSGSRTVKRELELPVFQRAATVIGIEDFRDGRVLPIYGTSEDQLVLRERLRRTVVQRLQPYF